MRPIVYIAIAAALQTSFAGGSASAQSINVPDALKRVIGRPDQRVGAKGADLSASLQSLERERRSDFSTASDFICISIGRCT